MHPAFCAPSPAPGRRPPIHAESALPAAPTFPGDGMLTSLSQMLKNGVEAIIQNF